MNIFAFLAAFWGTPDETMASQQAEMATAIKLHIPVDVISGELSLFR